jgi:hypothetical protein
MSAQRSGERSEPAQLSMFPNSCRCGVGPIREEAPFLNWCLRPELVEFETVEEWNEWTLNQWERV